MISVAAARKAIRDGTLRGAALLDFLVAHPPNERDAVVEDLLGIGHRRLDVPVQLGEDLVGYLPSGVAPIVQALHDVPVTSEDVLVDVGAGLGKVVLLAHLLTGARARGIDLQPELVEEARASASALGLTRCSYEMGDARFVDFSDGTVFFMYLPFTGAVMKHALENLRRTAETRPIVLCALGFDLSNEWLKPRTAFSFWLTVYDSCCPGVAPRVNAPKPDWGTAAERIADETA